MAIAAALALWALPAAASMLKFDVDPFYKESVLQGKFGETPVFFFLGPSPSMEKAVTSFIASADKTLDVCVYDLDLPEFAQALLDAHARGVKVRVIIADDNAAKAYAVADHLKQMEKAGILTELRRRESYDKPSVRKKKKAAAARKRALKKLRKMAR